MSIPTYQIHNVLKVFSQHLVDREKPVAGNEPVSNLPLIQQLPISEGKRAAVVERVAADILKKISRYREASTEGPRGRGTAVSEWQSQDDSRRFVYSFIGPDLQKKVRTIRDDVLKALADPDRDPQE